MTEAVLFSAVHATVCESQCQRVTHVQQMVHVSDMHAGTFRWGHQYCSRARTFSVAGASTIPGGTTHEPPHDAACTCRNMPDVATCTCCVTLCRIVSVELACNTQINVSTRVAMASPVPVLYNNKVLVSVALHVNVDMLDSAGFGNSSCCTTGWQRRRTTEHADRRGISWCHHAQRQACKHDDPREHHHLTDRLN